MIGNTLMRRREGNGNYWSPFDVFGREMSRWFGNLDESRDLVGSYPVDVREDENFIHVEAEMPGFKKDEIEVTLEKGLLHIQAQRKVEEKQGEQHLSERRFTRVSRSFTLPSSVDESKVDATLTDGVLHLKLHKREEVKPRKIQVK